MYMLLTYSSLTFIKTKGEATETDGCTISEVEERNGLPVYPCGHADSSQTATSMVS